MTAPVTPALFGLAGPVINAEEAALFRAARPAGYILFARNIADPQQLRALTDALRALHGDEHLPVLIDQEGGSVARLRPPHWPEFPSGRVFDALYDIAPASAIAAASANAQAIALILQSLGITVNCMPLLDTAQADAHPAIAGRTLGTEPMRVAALGRAVLDGLAAGGVVGVIKHMPGQGRASADSHVALPLVVADDAALEQDIAPFKALAHAPMGMTAHVVYQAWDAERCATMSETVIRDIIRGRIGFDGLLMTDGLEMDALSGTMADRARRALAAGVDVVLHCSGDFADMAAICEVVGGQMHARALARLDHAMHSVGSPPSDMSVDDVLARRDALLGLVDAGQSVPA